MSVEINFMSLNITLFRLPISTQLNFKFPQNEAFLGVHLLLQQRSEASQNVGVSSRPMWLNSHSCCKWQLFFAFFLEEERSEIYIYLFHQCRFSVPFQSCFCPLASWVISSRIAFLIRVASAPCGNLLELKRGSWEPSSCYLVTFLDNMYQIWVGFHSVCGLRAY